MIRTLIFFLLILFSISPLANEQEASEFLEQCISAIKAIDKKTSITHDWFDTAYCLGYVDGSRDIFDYSVESVHRIKTLGSIEYAKYFFPCVPAQVGRKQLVRILVKYLESNPEELHEPLSVLTRKAFGEAFPCG